MDEPPRDPLEFWIRFICAFGFFGMCAGLLGLRIIDSVGIWFTLGIWLAVTSAISLYAAIKGDRAWKHLLSLFVWW